MLEKSRQHLVKLADEHHLQLRQNYNRQAPRMAAQIGCYAHAKQFKRMRKALKALRIRVARVYREVTRKLGQLPEQAQIKAKNLLHRVGRILTQKTRGKNKLYALHVPEVECKVREWWYRSPTSIKLTKGLLIILFVFPKKLANSWVTSALSRGSSQFAVRRSLWR